MGARNFKARRKPFTLFFVLIGLTMAMSATLCSCGALLDSDREVERHLQELYGIPFEVIDAQRISDEHLQEGVWAAKVYEVIPQDDPDSPFWAYSIISGGNRRCTWISGRLSEYLCIEADGGDSWGRFGNSPVLVSNLNMKRVHVKIWTKNIFLVCVF